MSHNRHFQWVGIVAVFAVIGLSVACAPPAGQVPVAPAATEEAAPAKGGALIFAGEQDIDTLDPAKTTRISTRKVLNQIYDGLVRQKAGDPEIYPALAESWEVSEDASSYTFKLRAGVIFHDGTLLDAKAVKFTFDRIVDPETQAGIAKSFLGPYDSTEVIDEHTVRITFERPTPAFLALAALGPLGIVSPTAVEEFGEDFGRNPVGAGPFKFKEWVTKDHITLARFDDYAWSPPIFEHQGPAFLEEVRWNIVPEAGTRVGTLLSGEANVAEAIPPVDVQRIQTEDTELASVIPAGTTWSMYPNTQKFPTDDLNVRLALEYGVNRQAVVDVIFRGETEVAASPLQKAMPCYNSELEGLYPYDPEKAKSLLEEAGWVDTDGDGIREKDGQPLEVLWIFGTNNGYEEIAPLVQSQVREIGIDIQLQEETFAAIYGEIYRKGTQNIAEITWWYPDPQVMNFSFTTEAIQDAWNIARYSNPEVDEILREAASAPDPAERCNLYEEAQRIVMEDGAAIPLANTVTHIGVGKNVNGLLFTPVGNPLFYDVSLSE